ncbi:MAG: metal-dependent hydrolase [Chitinophagales bacterium]|nr:MAG: metal-dependent hydrolase [Chitinophagales bacterium]
MTAYQRLSYILDADIPVYGNGTRPGFSRINDMRKGATANKTALTLDSHMGTHIDFPLHFLADGRGGEDYQAHELVFQHALLVEVPTEGGLIQNNALQNIPQDVHLDLLLIKTGFCYKRHTDDYWQNNPGFASETAAYLQEKFPSLRAIGFDSISLSSFLHREEGRIAHRAFLSRNILIIEDMDLRNVTPHTRFEKIMVAPLLFSACDGAPCYVLAEIRTS